jgi:hypothetical protein
MLCAKGHVSMDIEKEICKGQGKEVAFHKGLGAGAIQSGLETMKAAA